MDRFRGLTRVFANAVVRRIAVLLVAAALAWMGIGNARAQTYSDQGTAYAGCMAATQAYVAARNMPDRDGEVRCVLEGSAAYRGEFQHRTTPTNPYFWAQAGIHTFPAGTLCSGRPDYIGPPPLSTASGTPVPGSMTCMNGCTASWRNNGDGTWTGSHSAHSTVCTNEELREDCASMGEGWGWNAYAQTCQPPKENCEVNQTLDPLTAQCVDSCPAGMKLDADGACSPQEDDCPAGNVKAPSGECLPGDGQCAAGEARRPNGTCGKDSDGDGEADEDDDDPENDPDKPSASGGDNCDSPPSCSGDAIACMQVKIQWRIDCNTRKSANVTGGTCGAIPVCTGKSCDALEYSQLLQQWKAACALEKLALNGTGDGGQPAWTRVDGMSQNPGAGESADDQPQLHEVSLTTDDLDQSGFGGGGSCAAIASAGGGQLSGGFLSAFASPPPMFCQFVGLIKALTILAASVASVYILARGGR